MFNRSKQRRSASQQNSEEIDAVYQNISSDPGRMRLFTAAYSVKLRRSMPTEMVKEILQHDRSSIRDQSNAFIERMDVMNDGVVEMLAGRPYGLLKAPRDKFFVLSDNPVLTRTPYGNGLLVGDGFNKPNVHVIMRLSPRYCLQIGLQGAFSRELQPGEVYSINRDMITLCHRAIYAPVSSDKLRAEVWSHAGTRKYRRNLFVMPPLKDEVLFDYLIQTVLGIDPASENDRLRQLWSRVKL